MQTNSRDSESEMWYVCNFYSISRFRDSDFGNMSDGELINSLKDMDIYFYNKDKSLHHIAFLAWSRLSKKRVRK